MASGRFLAIVKLEEIGYNDRTGDVYRAQAVIEKTEAAATMACRVLIPVRLCRKMEQHLKVGARFEVVAGASQHYDPAKGRHCPFVSHNVLRVMETAAAVSRCGAGAGGGEGREGGGRSVQG
jgi:hypothetical protein